MSALTTSWVVFVPRRPLQEHVSWIPLGHITTRYNSVPASPILLTFYHDLLEITTCFVFQCRWEEIYHNRHEHMGGIAGGTRWSIMLDAASARVGSFGFILLTGARLSLINNTILVARFRLPSIISLLHFQFWNKTWSESRESITSEVRSSARRRISDVATAVGTAKAHAAESLSIPSSCPPTTRHGNKWYRSLRKAGCGAAIYDYQRCTFERERSFNGAGEPMG